MKVADLEQGLICNLVKLQGVIDLAVDIDSNLDPGDLSGLSQTGAVKLDEEGDFEVVFLI